MLARTYASKLLNDDLCCGNRQLGFVVGLNEGDSCIESGALELHTEKDEIKHKIKPEVLRTIVLLLANRTTIFDGGTLFV